MQENAGNSHFLTRNQRRVIPYLLACRTVTEAADKAGLNERTIFGWLADDEHFQTALRQAEGQAIDTATRQLVALADTAITVLHLVMLRKDATDAVRVRAATAVLAHLLSLRELRNVEQRLARLEERINEQQWR